MRTTLLSILMLISAACYAQVTIPPNFLKGSMRNIDRMKSEGSLTDGEIKSGFSLLPTLRNLDYFEKDTAKFFQNNVISYNDSLSNIALYSELASDFLGPVRVSVGVTFAYPKSDTNSVEQKKINRASFLQKFSTGGGTVVFNFILPIFVYNSKIFSTNMLVGPRFSIDPPSFGVSSGKFAQNTAFGTDLQADLRGIKNVFKFYANTRISYIAGNGTFYDALQLSGNNRGAFWLNNYTIGVNIKDVFTLSYTKFWGSKSISDKLSGYLTFTVEPNFK